VNEPTDPLLESTWASRSEAKSRGGAAFPCLTILCHPDPARIGERSLLTGLVVRETIQISRAQGVFCHPGEDGGSALLDPFLSRKPLRLSSGRTPGSVIVDAERDDVRVELERLSGPREFSPAEVVAGIVIELSKRIALLLHVTSNPEQTRLGGIEGCSDAIEHVRRETARVASQDVPVLVRGETGVGKELVAQAIHSGSARQASACLSVNMATLSASTAVSELFGHARGAFTGAGKRHAGIFERANGGTLFLDEIGETPQGVQPMLLRALETGCIRPLGDEAERPLDLRFVAATDAALELQIAQGGFSAALMHRLAGYELEVPTLRERRDDIARLAVIFLRKELSAIGCSHLLEPTTVEEHPRLPAALMVQLVVHDYPGNVRELRNVIRQMAIASAQSAHLALPQRLQRTMRTDAPPAPPAPTPGTHAGAMPAGDATPAPAPAKRAKVSDEELLAALEQAEWSPERAATALGIPKSTVHYYIRKSPNVRRAADVEADELRSCQQDHAGDVESMARALRVSTRALRMALRQHGLLDSA